MIAQGIVDVLRETIRSGKPYPPLVVRLRGTGESEARSIVGGPLRSLVEHRLTRPQLEGAADLENIHVERDLNKAAQLAVDLAKGEAGELIPSPGQPVQVLSPVVFTKDGQYESTRENLRLEQDAKVLVMGTGKAVRRESYGRDGYSCQSLFHNSIAQDFGTNIVGACAPKREGTTFLGRPVYDTVGKVTRSMLRCAVMLRVRRRLFSSRKSLPSLFPSRQQPMRSSNVSKRRFRWSYLMPRASRKKTN
jgi:hypothetical protein